MQIITVTSGNLDKVAHIDRFFRENDFEYFSPHKNMASLLEEIKNASLDFYCIIEHDSKVIGYGILRGMDEGYEVPSLGIGIDKNFQGIGLGKLLMAFLELECKLRGYRKIRLRVYQKNIVAHGLYEKLGYVFHKYDEETLEGIKEI